MKHLRIKTINNRIALLLSHTILAKKITLVWKTCRTLDVRISSEYNILAVFADAGFGWSLRLRFYVFGVYGRGFFLLSFQTVNIKNSGQAQDYH